MFRRFFRVLGLCLLCVACCCFSYAQAQKASDSSADRLKLSASYLNTEFKANPVENIEYLKGVSFDADARIYSKGGWRIGGVFSFQRVYNVEVFSNYLGTGMDIYRDVDTFSLGAQLSKRIGPVEPFGAF